jgi:hypothetical protein
MSALTLRCGYAEAVIHDPAQHWGKLNDGSVTS